MAEINKNLMKVLQINQQVKAVTPSCETFSGPHCYNDCPSTVGQTHNVYAAGAYQGGNSYNPKRNNQGRNQFLQGASHGQNPPSAYQAWAYQAPGYQDPVHQPLIPQPQVATTTEFTHYMKANDAILKNMQTNMTSLTNSNLELKNIFGQFMKMNTASSLGSGTLPMENETEVTRDTVPPTNNGSTKDVQPLVVQIETPVPNSKPVIAPVIEPVAAPTGRALIKAYAGELTLRVNNKVMTFNLDQTLRYSANYNDMTANQTDVIDMACEEYSQEVLGFSDVIASGNPTSYYDPIVSTSSSTLTPFGDSDFILEEVDAFLALEDDPTSREVDHSYYEIEEDILLLEAFLNDDLSVPPPNQGMYLPQVQKEHKICKAKNNKSSIDESPKVELKDLPPHLEYAFLESDDKLLVIIVKDLSVEEKAAPIKVLKSHKQALAWKLFDIKGIDPEFYTHKILIEDDFEPAVQHQRRVHPKIYNVIKKEVLKLLDAGLIYPISVSPWVSPVHYVPKKGGFTIVENEENELILTRLVTGWRVCIAYRMLNEATHKDHFPLSFMDQMLERLAGNEYYCFLDGFSGYFQIPSILKIKNIPHSRVLTKHLPTVACLLAYAMHLARFKGEKSHFMVKEGNVLGHKISKNGIEVDKAKVDVITKLPYPTTVKGIHSFLGHAGFYRLFIQDFSKIARPMTHLLEKDTLFFFSNECIKAFQTLKKKLTEAPILIAPDWDLPFELMCDASDFVI
nr:reverse transcriptase domain-containing protein [Tanacetum cinerariifolium]